MPVAVINPPSQTNRVASDTTCVIQIQARLVSLNGGVVLALAMLFSAFFIAAFLTARMVAGQEVLFGILMLMSWGYLLDSATEKISLIGATIQRSSIFGRATTIRLDDLTELLLVHEGLNMNVGIESVTARYRDGHEERLPLGPCWRRSDLEAFLSSVEQELGNRKLLEEVR